MALPPVEAVGSGEVVAPVVAEGTALTSGSTFTGVSALLAWPTHVFANTKEKPSTAATQHTSHVKTRVGLRL